DAAPSSEDSTPAKPIETHDLEPALEAPLADAALAPAPSIEDPARAKPIKTQLAYGDLEAVPEAAPPPAEDPARAPPVGAVEQAPLAARSSEGRPRAKPVKPQPAFPPDPGAPPAGVDPAAAPPPEALEYVPPAEPAPAAPIADVLEYVPPAAAEPALA